MRIRRDRRRRASSPGRQHVQFFYEQDWSLRSSLLLYGSVNRLFIVSGLLAYNHSFINSVGQNMGFSHDRVVMRASDAT